MKMYGRLAMSLYALLAFVPHAASAETYHEIKLDEFVADEFPCKRLMQLLMDKREQPAAQEQMCARRLRPIPADFKEFALPDWQPIAQQDIDWPLIRDLWNTWIQHWTKLQGTTSEQIWNKQGLEQDIRRRLQRHTYIVQTARFDINNDGNEDSVLRMDTKQCTDDLSKRGAPQPYLGLYAYPKITGLQSEGLRVADDRLRLGDAAYSGDVLFFKEKPYVIEFHYGQFVLGPVATARHAQGVIWIRRLGVLPAVFNGSRLATTAPICTFSINR